MNDPASFRLRWRGQITGPFPLETILRRLDDNELGLWHEIEHQDAWLTLEEFLAQAEQERRRTAIADATVTRPAPTTHLSDPTTPTPPSIASVVAPSATDPLDNRPQVRPRRLKVFVAAGFLLGFLGAHNFYAGYRGTAIAQLLLTGVLFSLGFGLIATWLWALLELLVVHSDHRGMPMV
jgi:hypothetical protein